MNSYRERLEFFETFNKTDIVNLHEVREYCFQGIPDENGIRPLFWKILLNYLPLKKVEWREHLESKRHLYSQLINEFIICVISSPQYCLNDHPLNSDPKSHWFKFFKDNEILLQIDKDVIRLCPEISFFQQKTEYPCLQIVSNNSCIEKLHHRVRNQILSSSSREHKKFKSLKISTSTNKYLESNLSSETNQETHWEVVERILFLFAKLNPGQGYVQGMNEIIGPLYYVFATNPISEWRAWAEADTFFCFTNLMAEFRDFFIHTLDQSSTGISSLMNKLTDCLKIVDLVLWTHLYNIELLPQYYSFRWLTLLLSQDFPLPDVIRIWDSIFSHPRHFDFLVQLCCAMLINVRDQLLEGDFSACMKLLQNYPPTDIQALVNKAVQLEFKN